MAAVNAMHIIARQAASSATSALSSAVTSALPSSTIATDEPAMTQPSSTVIPTPPSPNPTGDTGGVTQNPLLFFVALGFGVVFTNLWIIVGVKYCFRYNARNRALAMQAQGGDIDLQNVTPAPRRRRRERKLLSIEEVNRQFPLQKYGAWMASRQAAGLPAEGGVDGDNAAAVVSRAQSLRNEKGVAEAAPASPVTTRHSMDNDTRKMNATEITVAPASPTTQRQSIDITAAKEKVPATTQTLESHEKVTDPHILAKYQTNNTTATIDPKNPDAHHSDAESEDEDAIHAIHPDVTDVPGDSCAICIDDLGEDEDIRGLTCGHTFHASCIDPWLTTRRACCPLCKRDYWVPKPRPEGETEETSEQRRRRRREREERRAQREANTVWAVRGTRIYLPGRFLGGGPVYVGGEGFASRLPPSEIRRRERAEMERQQQGLQEHAAVTLQRRQRREQARQDRDAARAAGGSRWGFFIPFERGGQQDPEAQARVQPQNAAEAQLMAQARGESGQQPQSGGFIVRLNPFGRSAAGSNAIGAGQSQAAEQATPTPGQVEAQAEAPATGRRAWRLR